jgi:hypothetical protein
LNATLIVQLIAFLPLTLASVDEVSCCSDCYSSCIVF